MRPMNACFQCTAVAIAAATAQVAFAGAHTWRLNEIFSNADGSIQFIELRECCNLPNEVNVNGFQVTSQATGKAFTFPSNLAPPTNNRHILLATQGFADLPGAPTPDHIIPANFFSLSGDTLRYHTYHTWVVAAGTVPTDCVNSLTFNVGVGPNSPTNYAHQTGQVDACPSKEKCPADLNGDQVVDVLDMLALFAAWGPNPGHPADLNGDNVVDVLDMLALFAAWGPCAK